MPSFAALWDGLQRNLSRISVSADPGPATVAAVGSGGMGAPHLVLPRLGQGLFRILVADAYGRRCAMTGERTFPVLEAAHIKPYSLVKRHEVSNGLLLRSDLHRLFDDGYITVDPMNRKIVVSRRIKEEFENGKEYYRLENRKISEPMEPWARPSSEYLDYHAYSVFK